MGETARRHLEDADLTGADLEYADLTVANLTGADLAGAKQPIYELLPAGWKRDPRSGLLERVGTDSGPVKDGGPQNGGSSE